MGPIFYIDTSEATSCYLLIRENKICSRRSDASQQDHSANIHLHLESMLKECSLTWSEIRGIAVLNGPGSYTGLRISLATAKGLCFAHDIHMLLFHKLELVFRAAQSQISGSVMVLQKAREQEFFVAAYQSNGQVSLEPQLMLAQDILVYADQHDCSLVAEEASWQFDFPKMTIISVEEDHILDMISKKWEEKNWAELIHSEPFYMKNVFINKINKL
ncbi:MAG TPA: tRNA (adenosine(37)-N6)-threonylcarbamoyltransferase complex dimerization subunit type 1 TsaB [Chitinophagaceae bacterium]|nr:tRNA (adenosine(37)-N6)-threonylcarbamoyltransferase complex dimerization subunit type 1 TsaB [Chitinophagaceae bacterium]